MKVEYPLYKPLSAVSATVTAGAAAQILNPASVNRRGFWIINNNAAGDIYVHYLNTVALTVGFIIPPKGSQWFNWSDQWSVWVNASAGTLNYTAIEAG